MTNASDAPSDPCSDPGEEDLLRRFGAGEVGAAELLSARLAPRLMAYAARVLGDRAEAEDVVQETMLRLWRIAPDWEPGRARVSTWAYRVATNLGTDRLRRRRPVSTMDVAETAPDPAPEAETRLLAANRARALEAALMDLPPRQRQAVVLRHLEGLSNPDIAAVMDIGVEAVESLTARGRRTLAARLAPQKNDLGYDDA